MIRPAEPAEAIELSALAFRSKAVWGYSEDFMEKCRAELSLDADFVRANPTFVLEHEGRVRGFYSLERRSAALAELGHLFLEPDDRGRGFGRALMEHACDEARRRGFRALRIQGDPNAEPFYLACGAVRIGTAPSASIEGRSLPLFEIAL